MTNASIVFFLQVLAILGTCRVVGWACSRFLGQPQVVGEMVAGVLLGPSLLGLLLPDLQQALFPAESKRTLYIFAQLGVGLYMFIVGMGFDSREFRSHARGAMAVSLSGILAPFLAAVLLAPYLMRQGGLFSPAVSPTQAILFLGAAIAITAFPMLARLIHEKGLSGSPLGSLSLAAGAIGDAAAWCLIAVVLAGLGGNPMGGWVAIGGAVAMGAFLWTIGGRMLRTLGAAVERTGRMSEGVLAATLILFAIAAWYADSIGIHAVFGGFALGMAMPRGQFVTEFRRKVEPVVVVLLLPFFFTYSGIHTRLDLLLDPRLLTIAALVLVVSILAKGGACYLAARMCGQSHRDSMGIGALMNARGLMELIVINIGLERGVIEPPLFTVLSLMAIVTTLLAGPLFDLAQRAGARGKQQGPAATAVPNTEVPAPRSGPD